MNTEFRYQLDKSSKKYLCPGCGKMSFVRYIDIYSKQLLPEKYGRCDREVNCSYHLNPYKDGYGMDEGSYSNQMRKHYAVTATAATPMTYIPADVLRSTLKGYGHNCFIRNLRYNVPYPFADQDLEKVIAQYFIGTVLDGDRAGAVTFPFINTQGRICAIQAKEFDLMNHTTGTDFIHSIIERSCQENEYPLPDWLSSYKNNDRKISCLFGDHLLKEYRHNPIALVEAPKTAVIGTLYFGFPDDPGNMLWLAVYNLSSLTYDKIQSLKGRHVYLFPDLSRDGKSFDLWSRRAREFSEKMPGTFFKISDLLEKEADPSERLKGSDIADYLIKQDWRRFRKEKSVSEKGENSEAQNKTFFSSNIEQHPFSSEKKILQEDFPRKWKHQGSWNQEISELEQFFMMRDLPKEPIRLSSVEVITDIHLFIEAELAVIRAKNGNKRYLPDLERLQELKRILSN